MPAVYTEQARRLPVAGFHLGVYVDFVSVKVNHRPGNIGGRNDLVLPIVAKRPCAVVPTDKVQVISEVLICFPNRRPGRVERGCSDIHCGVCFR